MPSFDELWRNHPGNWNPPVPKPCTDKKGKIHAALEDQCAIRFSIMLVRSNVSIESVRGARCWNNHGRDHVLRVKDYVGWVEDHRKLIGCDSKEVHRKTADKAFRGRRGIVLFLDFWGRNNDRDHIDVWDGARVGYGANDYFERSKEVWFWDMNNGVRTLTPEI
jgi:hypothetical protein